MVRIEVHGQVLTLPRAEVEGAQALAAAEAGSSSRLRDLALVLDWAMHNGRVVALRRSEAREFERLAQRHASLATVASVLAAVTEQRERAA